MNKWTKFLLIIVIMGIVFKIGVENEKLEAQFIQTENPTLEEKGRLLISKFTTKITPHEDIQLVNKNDINYFVPPGTEGYPSKVDGILKEQKEVMDRLFDTETKDALTFAVKDEGYIEDPYSDERSTGYYDPMNSIIKINVNDKDINHLVKHEYAHYRMDQFEKRVKGKTGTLPRWFIEGFAEYYSKPQQPMMKLETTLPFDQLETRKDMMNALQKGEDPYFQGFLAVSYLIKECGENVISELLVAGEDEFYKTFEEKTGKTMEEIKEIITR